MSSTAPIAEWAEGHAGNQGMWCWVFESYGRQEFFVMFTCSLFLADGLAAFK